METNTQPLIAAIIALACFLPFSEAMAETLIYKGTITVVGFQTKENFTDIDPPTKERIRKRVRVILILSTTGPEKAVFYIDPRAKTFNFDVSSLTKLPVNFFGVNGRPSSRSSIQNFVTKNFTTSVDRDSAGGDDTSTTKAGSLSGNLRDFKIGDTPVFAAKTLRGKYLTTRCSDVVSALTAGYDPGSEFTTFEERVTLRIHRRDSAEHISDTVSETFSKLLDELDLDDAFDEGPIDFTDGFESGDTSAWSSGTP
jgi:hypothetical protein